MKILMRGLWALVVIGVLLYVGLTFWLATSALFFPYALDYGEGIVVWFTDKLAQGQTIYPVFDSAVFDGSNYPPVAMVLAAMLRVALGDALFAGRWLAFACTLIVAAFIVRWVKSATRDGRASLLAAGFFLGSTFIYHWMPLFRVDMPGVAFALAGIFCVWRWERADRRQTTDDGRQTTGDRHPQRLLLFAILFFLTALYTKHSLLFAPAAAVVAIFLRDKRAALFFAAALGALGAALFLLLEIFTRGGWSFGIVTMNATVWTPRVLLPLLQSFLLTYAVLLGLGAWSWWTRVRQRKFGVLEIYAAAALLSLALAGREGAWENYFLEAIAMSCVFAGIAIANLAVAKQTAWQFGLPLLLLLQLGLFWQEHDPRVAQNLFDEVRAGNQQLAPLIQNAQGTVIAEDTGLLWKNGKPVAYYSFPFSALARAGRYDQKWEIENLRAGNFPLVILYRGTRANVDAFGNFTRAFVSALDYAYAPTIETARYQVYEPAPLQEFAPQARFGETFELVGWKLTPSELRAGDALDLTIVWRALQKPPARFTMFAQLAEAKGGNIAQVDLEPQHGAAPTTQWAAGEMVRDIVRLQVPQNVPPGEYVLRIGWYDTLTQENLSTASGEDVVELKRWRVE